MSSMGDYTTAGDRLWTAVMQNEIAAHGNFQGKKWRTVNKQTVACDSCKDSGASVLLRCGHEKCPREFHIDCAFHQGGLTLDDIGVLNVFCESHFKALVFCSCKEPYDDARPMVFCDECCDWFHNKCEGLTANEAASIDKYTCKNCREILRQGRSVSKVIKEKNMAKENRSVHQQSATKAVGLLAELEGGLCPIIDEIGTKGKSQWAIKDIEDAKSVVCAPPFTIPAGAEMNEMDAQSAELLDKLGVMPVVDAWRTQLVQYLDHYDQWRADAEAYFKSNIHRIVPQFESAQLPVMEELRGAFVGFSERASTELVGIPVDLEAFGIFLDCLSWMVEFLQVLHQSPKADNWIPSVGACLRAGAARYKHLAAHSKDFFCGSFAELFQTYHKTASAQVSAMGVWYNETYKILSTEMDYTLTDLDTYLRSADDFPARPLLYEELSTVVTEAWGVEKDILTALSDPATSAEQLTQLTLKKSELGVALPSEHKLSAASDRHVYLSAYAMAMAQDRLRKDLAVSLIDKARALLSSSPVGADVPEGAMEVSDGGSSSAALSSVLFGALGEQVQQVEAALQQLLDEATTAVQGLVEQLQKWDSENDFSSAPQRLEQLRTLKVIAPEEELLEFIQNAKALQEEAQRSVPTLGSSDDSSADLPQWASLSTVQRLVKQIEAALRITVVDQFETSHKHKTSLSKLLTNLVDQQEAAERLWTVVASAVQDCQRGVPVTQETLREAMAQAEASRIRDEGVSQRATELLQRAEQDEARFLRTLESIVDASEESVRTARTMLEEAKFLPLSAAGAQRIAQRCSVCTAVFESQRILAQSSSTNSAALSEREMHTVRELSHTINRLSSAELVGPESDLLNTIKEPILLFLWRAEVHFLWLHPIAPAAAEQIRAHGEQLGDAAKGFPEWTELNAEIQRGETFLQAAQTAIAEVDQCKLQFSDDLAGWQTASGPLEEKLRALVTEDATLRIKTSSITTALAENLDLLATLRTAQATLVAVRAEMASESSSSHPVVDFRAITYYTNQLSALAEKHPSFPLLLTRKEEMSRIHSAASRWNESASALLPQQMSTRHKIKPEASQVTLPQLLARLAEPIARAVSTPMHEKFKTLLADVDAFRISFMTFLLPPDFPIKDSSNFQSPDFSAKLQEDIVTIGEMKRLAELIPLDLPEFRVLQWVSALFEWISSIPYPGDDPKQHAVPMDQALKKMEESEPIVGTIPGNVIETLCQLGVMNLDEAAGPVGFHANIHPYFNLAGDLSEHLEQQVKHSEQLQLRIKQAVDTKRPTKELLQLQEESAGLLVQMSVPIRRALDRAMGKSGVRGSGAQRGSDQYESESSEYSDREEEEEVEADNYWSEKTASKGKTNKRARDTDSLVSIKRPEPSARVKVEEKPAKKSRSLCTNPDCPTSAAKARGSLYCSNHCAMVTAPQVYSALLHYRKLLCLYGSVQRRLISVDDPNGTLSKVSDADWKAFTTAVPAPHEASADMISGMKSAGFVAESLNPSRPTPNRSGDALETFLKDGEHTARLQQSHGAAENPATPIADRKTSYIHTFLSALPPAAGPVFLRGDAEGLTQHSAAVKAAGGTPVSVGAGTKQHSAVGASVDEDLRLKIRYGLEELLERTLSRLQVAGAANHAAFIALDFEDELCHKYATAESKAAKKGLVFDKKEYRKHYLMLVSNLRKTHNDQLIMKLVSNEISLESLLEMTAVQLADSSTQQRRQQQLTNVVKDALRESTQETLEAARRQVMGTESENSVGLLASAQEVSDAQRASLSTASTEDLPPSPKHSLKLGGSMDSTEDHGGMDVTSDYSESTDGSASSHASSVSSRSLEIEQKVSSATSGATGSTSKPKRPIDADAITRMTTSSFKPNKAPRLENSDGTESTSTPRGNTTESPRAKPTALLSSILSNKAAVAAATASPKASGDSYHFEEISSFASLRAPMGSGSAKSSALPKLINSEGGHEISIVRPAHGSGAKNIVMKGEAVVGDRKLQGILTSPCNIDGRVKLDEFKRIINKLLAILEDPRTVNLPNRKLLSVFKMTVQPDVSKDGSTSYDMFCTEFTRDLRVGYCNPGNGNSQLYVLPPAHKNCLPIFQCLDNGTSGDDEKNVLYGVLTSKDQGPEQYTQEDDLAPGGFSWDVPAVSAPVASKSVSASDASAGIATMSKATAPPPPAPPSGLKKTSSGAASGVSPPVPPPLPPRAPGSAPVAPTSVVTPTAPTSVTVSTTPVPPPAPAADPIQRVAVFVATRGIQMMRELQAKPETRSVMPFLFDNHPDHSKFLLALKAAMEQKNAPK